MAALIVGLGSVATQAPAESLPPVAASTCPLLSPSSPTETPCQPTPSPTLFPRCWMDADYLLWWVKKGPAIPLVSTGPEVLFSGSLDQASTRVLFGQDRFDYGAFSGMRRSGGVWLDEPGTVGLEASGLLLERRSVGFDANGDSNGHPFLARPFIDALTGHDNVYFVSQNFADPGLRAGITGGISAVTTSRLWSWEVDALLNTWRSNSFALNLLGGFRNLSLRESLHVTEAFENVVPGGGTSFLGTVVNPPGAVGVFDGFDCNNQFYGGQVGARMNYRWGRVSVDAGCQVALGVSQELVRVGGNTTLFNGGVVVRTTPGGILALPTNSGNHFQNDFAVVPEANLKLSYQLTKSLSAQVGYVFLYWSSVARPGAQVDQTVNPNLVPIDRGFTGTGSLARPEFDFHATSFWAQGINFGLLCRF
jgi:hypothetical protein